jgi:hypothetical protein
MKTILNPLAGHRRNPISVFFLIASAWLAPFSLIGAETGRTFATPEEAVSALNSAVTTTNRDELLAIFGPALKEIANPDRVQAANEYAAFAAALIKTNWLVHETDTDCTLELGADSWPFPVPIVQKEGRWFFDTAAGKEEILNRRIGRNEIETLKAVRTYAKAQRKYAQHDRDGDEVLEYAQKIISSPGLKDGLYWPPELDGEVSPLGPAVAAAEALGYGKRVKDPESAPAPFQGYYFRILTGQGKHAPGGKYDYITNGNMIGGFALVAWPAEYGDSGIMTFMVNQQGRVYQKDLGTRTTAIAESIKVYDPDQTWTISPD